jgi:hypothetical protein
MNVEHLVPPIPLDLYKELAQLTPKRLTPCLHGKNPINLDFAKVEIIVGSKDNKVVALCLVSLYMDLKEAEIHLIAFNDERLTTSEMTFFIEQIDNFLESSHTSLYSFILEKKHSSYDKIKNCLLSRNWQGPRLLLIECRYIRAHFNPGWLYKNISIPEKFKIKRWNDLTDQEIENLIIYADQKAPFYIHPFGLDPVEKTNSLVLFFNETVAGWMVTHRIDSQEIRYSALYLNEEYRDSMLWLKLLSESLFIHEKEIGEATLGTLEVNVDQISKNWLRFVQKKLYPLAFEVIEKDLFWKYLKEQI